MKHKVIDFNTQFQDVLFYCLNFSIAHWALLNILGLFLDVLLLVWDANRLHICKCCLHICKQSVSTMKSVCFSTFCYESHCEFTELFNVLKTSPLRGPGLQVFIFRGTVFTTLPSSGHISHTSISQPLRPPPPRLSSELQWPVEASLDTSSSFFSKHKHNLWVAGLFIPGYMVVQDDK